MTRFLLVSPLVWWLFGLAVIAGLLWIACRYEDRIRRLSGRDPGERDTEPRGGGGR